MKEKNREDENQITLVLTYHPAYKDAWKILKEAHQILHLAAPLKDLFPKPPRLTFRNARSLKDNLVFASVQRKTDDRPRGNYGCKDKRCQIHRKYMARCDTFESTKTRKEYNIKGHFDCNSECIVYLITCKTCQKQYVGSTITRCRDRFNKYTNGIVNYGKGIRGRPQEHLFEHFHSQGHDGSPEQIKLQIIDRCHPNNQELRESYWAFTLKTVGKDGLNDHLPMPKKQKVQQKKPKQDSEA